MIDVLDQVKEYASARVICGKRNKGDELLQTVSAELARTRDLMSRLARGPMLLSRQERSDLGIMERERD